MRRALSHGRVPRFLNGKQGCGTNAESTECSFGKGCCWAQYEALSARQKPRLLSTKHFAWSTFLLAQRRRDRFANLVLDRPQHRIVVRILEVGYAPLLGLNLFDFVK